MLYHHGLKITQRWWSSGKISDNDFLTGIEYLIENGIIKVNVKQILNY